MRLVTNQGSNLTPAIIERYAVEMTPQQIVVDGVNHDTRELIPLATVDHWVKTAKVHPHILGTAAAEYMPIFRRIVASDPEVVALMTSKKTVPSYSAAVSAAKTLTEMLPDRGVKISVVDTLSTDLAACLCTILAGEAIRAGLGIERVTTVVERFAARGVLALTLGTLDYLVKSGRASFLRAWLANLLDVTPLITFREGELQPAGRVSRSKDLPTEMAKWLETQIGSRDRPVWAAVSHGANPEGAAKLAKLLRANFNVTYLQVRELASAIYLNCGPGALAAFVYPIDELGFTPPVPPDFG